MNIAAQNGHLIGRGVVGTGVGLFTSKIGKVVQCSYVFSLNLLISIKTLHGEFRENLLKFEY